VQFNESNFSVFSYSWVLNSEIFETANQYFIELDSSSNDQISISYYNKYFFFFKDYTKRYFYSNIDNEFSLFGIFTADNIEYRKSNYPSTGRSFNGELYDEISYELPKQYFIGDFMITNQLNNREKYRAGIDNQNIYVLNDSIYKIEFDKILKNEQGLDSLRYMNNDFSKRKNMLIYKIEYCGCDD
jgi:hypothetical protein